MPKKHKRGPAPPKPKPRNPAFQKDRGRPTLNADGTDSMLPPLPRVHDDDMDLRAIVKRTNALPLEAL